MKSELLAKSPLLVLPLTALFLFIVVFAGIVFITMKKRAPAYDPIARLPFEDGDALDTHHDREAEQGGRR